MRIAQSLCAYVIAFAICTLTTFSMFAQLPSYLPADGLVAWYPFNGNANDESGNGNNGQLQNGAALTTDRLGIENSASFFDGIDDHISLPGQFNNGQTLPEFTISIWFI